MKKILLIDYDQNSLASLRGILSKEGYEVVTAADGQAGWDKYNKEAPDLVLMEAMLPKVHGFELCQRITSEKNSQTPVFIMTGVYKDRVYRTEALRTYGASEYFEKPLKMAEIMASIEAVLGKPEPRHEPKPVRETRPEPVVVEPRKREKPRSDDDKFSLPADLDQLSRNIPKMWKPAPARHEAPAETRFESLADDLLKSVIAEPVTPKKVEDRANSGNGNGHGNADIDQFLKSALAGLDIDKEKVKAPKAAPLAAPPVEEPPKPTPPPTVVFKPKFTPPPAPVVEKPVIEKPMASSAPAPDTTSTVPVTPAAKSTLTPGDPGSDTSPFFTLEKPKPAARAEAPKAQVTFQPPAVPAAAPKLYKPAERPRPEPVKQEAAKPEHVRTEPGTRDIVSTPSGDIFQPKDIFEHVEETKTKRGFPPLVAVGIGVAVLAVAGFLFLRPKSAPKNQDLTASQTVIPSNVPAQPVEEVPPPEVTPEPVKPKPQPQTKTAEPVAEGIVAPLAPAAAPLLSTPKTDTGNANTQTASVSNPVQADPPPVKTEQTPPPEKAEEVPVQGTTTVAGTAAAPVPAPAGPAAKEGDLVELSAATVPPSLLKRVNPIYPQIALQQGVEGTITVNALIDEKGNVIDTGILKGIQDDRGLGRAAETAVKKWKFEPARKDGVAVKVWKSFPISFKTEKKAPGATE